MPKLKLELNSNGIRDLLKSAEIAAYVKDVADERRKGCGDGYDTDSKVLSGRVVSSIYTVDSKTALKEMENHTLLKAVGR